MLLTAYMKMIRNCPQLKGSIVPIFEQYQDHWDEDIQQRVCEYLSMLKRAEEDPSVESLMMETFDILPNFSESLQANSILTRRIMKLKVSKGFSINQEEVEKSMKQGTGKYNTAVSQVLSTN